MQKTFWMIYGTPFTPPRLSLMLKGLCCCGKRPNDNNWDLNYGSIALMWREGCIIRSAFLENIKEAYENDPALLSLLLDDYFKTAVHDAQRDGGKWWQRPFRLEFQYQH